MLCCDRVTHRVPTHAPLEMKKKTAVARVSVGLAIYSSAGLDRSLGGVGRDTAVEPGEMARRGIVAELVGALWLGEGEVEGWGQKVGGAAAGGGRQGRGQRRRGRHGGALGVDGIEG